MTREKIVKKSLASARPKKLKRTPQGTATLEQLMDWFGVAKPTINQWHKKGIAIRVGRDCYDIAGTVKGYVQLQKQKPEGKPELEKSKLRAEIRLREIRIAREQADVLPIVEIEQILTRVLGGIKQALYADHLTRLQAEGPGKDSSALGQLAQQSLDAILSRAQQQVAEWIAGKDELAAAIRKQIEDAAPKVDETETDAD